MHNPIGRNPGDVMCRVGSTIARRVLRLAAFVVLALGLPALAAEQDPESQALVERVVQAYGGAQAIDKVLALNAKGHIKSLMRRDVGSYQRWFARPRQLRVETVYAHSSETRILNGQTAWRSGPGGRLGEVSGMARLATIYQFKQLDLLHGLASRSVNLRHLGRETLGERQTEAMQVWDDEGPVMRVDVDTGTHFIVRVSAEFRDEGGSAILAIEFSEFRQVDGLPLPFKLDNFVAGMRISETVITHYAVNPPLAPTLFQPRVEGQGFALLDGAVAATPGGAGRVAEAITQIQHSRALAADPWNRVARDDPGRFQQTLDMK